MTKSSVSFYGKLKAKECFYQLLTKEGGDIYRFEKEHVKDN